MATIKITISAENAQAIKALQQVAKAAKQTGNNVKEAGSSASFAGATKSAGSLLGTLGKVSIVGAAIIYVFRELKEAASALLEPGFEFTKNMETNRLGMAGILQSMTLIDGKAVDFNQAMAISSDMMKKLQQDALRTAASTEDLVEVFRAVLAPGLNAGMTLDQIRQITTVGTNAIKSLGIPRQQIVQELRDLVQGGITAAGSTLATALGITDADIKKAKESSEGLFKYLMDRMQGFEETAKRFPDTLDGKLDQLNEMWTMAGGEFAKEFEEPLKDGLQMLSDLIGTVNAETGRFEVNPAITGFLNDVKSGYREIKELIRDVKRDSDGLFDSAANSARNLYGAAKDLGAILTDLTQIAIQVSLPGMKLLGEELDQETKRFRWLTGKVAYLLELLAEFAGYKQPEQSPGVADYRQSEDSNALPSFLNITPKFPDATKAIENSQAAMKIALGAIEADAKKAAAAIKKEQDSIEVLYKQSLISAEEYARRKTELEMKIQQVAVDEAQRKLEAIQAAQYDKDNDKKAAVSKANNELEVEVDKLKAFGVGLDDVNKAIGAMTDASDTWRKEVENVNIDGLQDNAKAAIDALGAYFYKLTGQQMVVSSGLRDWGGHVSGTKFDVVDDAASEMLEKNVDGIRDKIIAYAEAIGLQVLDEYDNPSEHATGGHLDINAKDFTATMAAQAKARIGQVLTKNGIEYLNSILELMNEADEIVKSLVENRGDISSQQKAKLTAEYDDLRKKFTNSLLPESNKKQILDRIDQLQKSEFLKLDFTQSQNDLELANGELVTVQEDLMNELAAGTKTATQVSGEYVKQYNAKTQAILAELKRQLADAGDNRELANKIRAAIRSISDKLGEFFDAMIARIDSELQHEIAMINADRNLTDLQRQDKIDEVTRQKAAERAERYEAKAREIRDKGGNISDAMDYEKAADLNRKLAEIPALLDKIRQAGKQGLEDGLLEFMERGVLECRNLGEAFRNLANSILQSIQRVYAEALTKNIMSALGLGSKGNTGSAFQYNSPGVSLPGGEVIKFAEGGSMESGMVSGPGTSTSDSILAWVSNIGKMIRISNGEFVMRGAAVAKYGRAALERLNSGKVPIGMLRQYAVGGPLTDRSFSGDISGPQELSANLSNSTTIPLSIMNVLDPGIMGRYMQTRDGKRALLNYIKDEAGTIKRVLSL